MKPYRGGSVSQGEDAPAERTFVCRKCQTPTAHATLASYGAQCFPCYASSCRTSRPRVPSESPGVRDMLSRVRGRLPGVTL